MILPVGYIATVSVMGGASIGVLVCRASGEETLGDALAWVMLACTAVIIYYVGWVMM